MSDNEIKSINGTKEKVLAGLFWTFGERSSLAALEFKSIVLSM